LRRGEGGAIRQAAPSLRDHHAETGRVEHRRLDCWNGCTQDTAGCLLQWLPQSTYEETHSKKRLDEAGLIRRSRPSCRRRPTTSVLSRKLAGINSSAPASPPGTKTHRSSKKRTLRLDPCGCGAVPYRRALRVLWSFGWVLANTSIYSIIRLATRLQRHVHHEFFARDPRHPGCSRQAESDVRACAPARSTPRPEPPLGSCPCWSSEMS